LLLKQCIFDMQATILGCLDCSNIVQYLESGKSKRNDVFWFVMELLVGDPLDEWLEMKGFMTELEAVKVSAAIFFMMMLRTAFMYVVGGQVGLDVCAALKSLHQIDVIHR